MKYENIRGSVLNRFGLGEPYPDRHHENPKTKKSCQLLTSTGVGK